jgi:transcription initiation factor TFIID TATA-box-binding protein
MSGFNIATPSMTTPAMQTPSIPTPLHHNSSTPFALPTTPAPLDAPTPSSRDANPYAVAGITPTLQ